MGTMVRSRVWLLAAGAAAVVAGSAYAAAPGASSKAERTIHLREASAKPVLSVVDTGAAGLSAGDEVVTTDGVVRTDGTPAGSMAQVCTVVQPGPSLFASTFWCVGSFDLDRGSITVAGRFVPTDAESTFALTGGTGRFEDARGEVVLAAEADTIAIELG